MAAVFSEMEGGRKKIHLKAYNVPEQVLKTSCNCICIQRRVFDKLPCTVTFFAYLRRFEVGFMKQCYARVMQYTCIRLLPHA